MKTNRKTAPVYTHEGVKASHINAELQLRRSVLANLLWEDTFYEDGVSVAKRIENLIPMVAPETVAALAIEAREKMKLRHIPLLLVRAMARLESYKGLVSQTLARIIQRPDEITEFVSIYWLGGKQPLSNQVKKGLALAFNKFDEYAMGKYNRDGAVKLRDALFLCHAKPENKEKEILFKKIVDNTLAIPDTWEVQLSAGKDKKETFERLMTENKLGGLALLRNLRNMLEAKVNRQYIASALETMKVDRILPYRFITAARYAPDLEPELETAMFKCIEGRSKLMGRTILLVDVSGSMDAVISNKSDVTRIDAACGLAILVRELCESATIVTFSDSVVKVPPRRGFALRDAIEKSQPHSGTDLGGAIRAVDQHEEYDRMIVISDEQSHSSVPSPKRKAYIINVSTEKHGVGYGAYTHIDGFSEAVFDWIGEYEKLKD